MSIALIVLAFIAVLSGMGVALSRDAVHSALNLTVNLLTVGVFYLTMGLQFLGMAQLLIYAGAIMVVFLFAVTVLAPDEEQGLNTPNPKLLAGLCVGSVIGAALLVTARVGMNHIAVAEPVPGTVHEFALRLFGRYAFPFEITAFLLLVALIGSVLLGHRRLKAVGIPTQPPTVYAQGTNAPILVGQSQLTSTQITPPVLNPSAGPGQEDMHD